MSSFKQVSFIFYFEISISIVYQNFYKNNNEQIRFLTIYWVKYLVLVILSCLSSWLSVFNLVCIRTDHCSELSAATGCSKFPQISVQQWKHGYLRWDGQWSYGSHLPRPLQLHCSSAASLLQGKHVNYCLKQIWRQLKWTRTSHTAFNNSNKH